MPEPGRVARAIWIAAGLAWAATWLVLLTGPAYWEPVTAMDWAAVVLYLAAWILTAPAILLLARFSPSRLATALAVIVAVAAVATGVVNFLEDGLYLPIGTLYVASFLTAWIGLLALAAATPAKGTADRGAADRDLRRNRALQRRRRGRANACHFREPRGPTGGILAHSTSCRGVTANAGFGGVSSRQ